MKLSPAWEGALRTLGILVLTAVVGFFANAANINGLFSAGTVIVITTLAGALENYLKAKSGGTSALFGAVSLK